MLTIQQTGEISPEIRKGKVRSLLHSKMPGIPVSAVIITRNEAANIRRTLSKLYWCDEIIVVDSYSTDDTVDICKEFGCQVYSNRFEGYGAQKKYAVSKAKNNWILSLDADEVLSDALILEMTTELHRNKDIPYSGYQLPMNLVFLDKEFRYGKESQRYFLRLFDKRKGNFNNKTVHEKIELEGEVSRFGHRILHYSYTSFDQWYKKCEYYTTLSAEAAVEKGKNKSLLAVLFALPYYFFRYYFIERNFMNGENGFYWSVFCSYYHLMKYAKIRKLSASRNAAPIHLFKPPLL